MYSGSFLNINISSDVEVISENVCDSLLQALRGFRVLCGQPIKDKIVLLVLFKLVHFLLQLKEQTLCWWEWQKLYFLHKKTTTDHKKVSLSVFFRLASAFLGHKILLCLPACRPVLNEWFPAVPSCVENSTSKSTNLALYSRLCSFV